MRRLHLTTIVAFAIALAALAVFNQTIPQSQNLKDPP